PCIRAPHFHTFLLILSCYPSLFFFFFNDPAPPQIYTLSLHDALPISRPRLMASSSSSGHSARGSPIRRGWSRPTNWSWKCTGGRSEEHTSELQSRFDLVCRLLLEKKK